MKLDPEDKLVIERCVRSEVEAVEIALADRPPGLDEFGTKRFDVREDWLRKLRATLDRVRAA